MYINHRLNRLEKISGVKKTVYHAVANKEQSELIKPYIDPDDKIIITNIPRAPNQPKDWFETKLKALKEKKAMTV